MEIQNLTDKKIENKINGDEELQDQKTEYLSMKNCMTNQIGFIL